jgi:tRNA acetyltransferase TAN1
VSAPEDPPVPAEGAERAPASAAANLLVSYPWRYFRAARAEIIRVLAKCEDAEPHVERSAVPGIALVESRRDAREVVKKCRDLFDAGERFHFAVKWVPVDLWCETGLDAIKAAVDAHVRDRIEPGQSWAMRVEKRRWQQHHTSEIVEFLARDIDRRVDLRAPDWILRVDMLGPLTAISLLKPDETFSIRAPRLD